MRQVMEEEIKRWTARRKWTLSLRRLWVTAPMVSPGSLLHHVQTPLRRGFCFRLSRTCQWILATSEIPVLLDVCQ